jgi:hypothetical protein
MSLEICSNPVKSRLDGSEWGRSAPQLDIYVWELMNSQLVEALTMASLENLTDLRLSLPCTRDFKRLSESLPQAMCERLKTLYLEITDATGIGGSRSFLEENYDNDEIYVPYSNLQQLHPNVDREFEPERALDTGPGQEDTEVEPTSGNELWVFILVARCRNLETLGLVGTQALNLNLFSRETKLPKLTDLLLCRIKTSAKTLIHLLSPAMNTPLSQSPLSRVWLNEVELTSGIWAQVCECLLQCPNLTYLYPMDLNYSCDGESAHLRASSCRMWEEIWHIWTKNKSEQRALKSGVWMLIERAGGKENFPKDHWDSAMLEDDDSDDDSNP